MQKILKLSTVSMLAIVAASNANAAGYTCEELIEYTSCNTGYYLNAGDCIEGTTCGAGNYITGTCPEGSVYDSNWCWVQDSPGDFVSGDDEYCEESGGDLLGPGCISQEILGDSEYSWYYEHADDENWSLTDVITPVLSYTCSACAAGEYQPSAGQYSCLTCPAGSECPTTTTATLCEIGTYSSAGATSCTSCPTTGLTDKDGKTVVATTASKGTTGLGFCYIADDVMFQDDKGIYHYTSECGIYGYTPFDESVATETQKEARCTELGGTWDGGECVISYDIPETEAECNKYQGTWEPDGFCICDSIVTDLNTGNRHCSGH